MCLDGGNMCDHISENKIIMDRHIALYRRLHFFLLNENHNTNYINGVDIIFMKHHSDPMFCVEYLFS